MPSTEVSSLLGREVSQSLSMSPVRSMNSQAQNSPSSAWTVGPQGRSQARIGTANNAAAENCLLTANTAKPLEEDDSIFDPFSEPAPMVGSRSEVPLSQRRPVAGFNRQVSPCVDEFSEIVSAQLRQLGRVMVVEHGRLMRANAPPRMPMSQEPSLEPMPSVEPIARNTKPNDNLKDGKPSDVSWCSVVPVHSVNGGVVSDELMRDGREVDLAAAESVDIPTVTGVTSPVIKHAKTFGITLTILPGWFHDKGNGVSVQNSEDEDSDEEIDPVVLLDEAGSDSYICSLLMMPPGWGPHTWWDIVAAMWTLYECMIIPIMFIGHRAKFMEIASWIGRIFWTLDFALQFFTGYYDSEGRLEMRPRLVAMRYFVTWFPIDITALSADWMQVFMESNGGDASAALAPRVAKVFRFVRLLRMMRLTRVLRSRGIRLLFRFIIESVVSPDLVNVAISFTKLVGFFVWLNHIIACAWVWLGQNTDDPPDSSTSSFRAANWLQGHALADEDLMYLYLCGFHWSLQQFSGAAELWPWNRTERTFALISGVLTFVMSIYIGASLTSTMTHFEILTSHDSKRMADLKNFIDENDISNSVAIRVVRNAQYAIMQTKKKLPESRIELLKVISTPLQMELHYEVRMPVLATHPFFREFSFTCTRMMQHLCQFSIESIQLSKGDILFVAGEVPKIAGMFFVVEGEFSYRHRYGSKHLVSKGEWIVEPAVWVPWVYCGAMSAREESKLYLLDAVQFQYAASLFQKDVGHAQKYGQKVVDYLNFICQSSELHLSDLHDPDMDVETYAMQTFPKKKHSRRRLSSRGSTFADQLTNEDISVTQASSSRASLRSVSRSSLRSTKSSGELH